MEPWKALELVEAARKFVNAVSRQQPELWGAFEVQVVPRPVAHPAPVDMLRKPSSSEMTVNDLLRDHVE